MSMPEGLAGPSAILLQSSRDSQVASLSRLFLD